MKGMISVSLPRDRTALSIVGNRTNTRDMQNGDAYESDGYVYRNGERLKKWFSHRHGWNHFWEPTLGQVARIETLHYKLQRRNDATWEKIKAILYMMVASGKTVQHHGRDEAVAHARALHESDPKIGWWQYRAFKSDYSNGLAYSFDWIEEPEEKINLELGQKLYRFDYRRNWFSGHVREILNEAIIKFIRDSMPQPQHRIDDVRYDLTINGRMYTYRGYMNQYNYPTIEKLMWGEERIHTVTL